MDKKKATTEAGKKKGGRAFGATAGLAATVWTLYSSGKTIKDHLDADPDHARAKEIREELDKVTIAISCIGREKYNPGAVSSIYEGGAINALGNKAFYGNTDGQVIVGPDPGEAIKLISTAIEKVSSIDNVLEHEELPGMKMRYMHELMDIANNIVQPRKINYSHYQKRLSNVADGLKAIEGEYKLTMYDHKARVNGRVLGYAGKGLLAVFTGPIKPRSNA